MILPFKLDFDIAYILLLISSFLALLSCLIIVATNNIVKSIMLLSIFSLSISICYLLMDAPDVAMTEVALGATLSSAVLLNMVQATSNKENFNYRFIFSYIVCVMLVLIFSIIYNDLPEFGASNAIHINDHYIANVKNDIGIKSFVAAILASYRGYDTLGETIVILIAGLSVLLILSSKNRDDVKKT